MTKSRSELIFEAAQACDRESERLASLIRNRDKSDPVEAWVQVALHDIAGARKTLQDVKGKLDELAKMEHTEQ